MTTQDLQTVVAGLSPDDLTRFSTWFEEFMADQWDRQIEADLIAGRFDATGQRMDEDFRAGRCTPL